MDDFTHNIIMSLWALYRTIEPFSIVNTPFRRHAIRNISWSGIKEDLHAPLPLQYYLLALSGPQRATTPEAHSAPALN